MALDWDGSVIPGSVINKRNKLGSEVVAPKSTITTLPAHAQYDTATPAVYKTVPNANAASTQMLNKYAEVGGQPATTTTPSFLGGLASSLADGFNKLGFNAPTTYTPAGSYTPMTTDNNYVYKGTNVDFEMPNTLPEMSINNGGLASTLSGAWDSIGGAKGFADLAGGLGALGSLYSGYQANKRADNEMDALNFERARILNKDKAFAKNIAASGLGSYSAGVK